MTFAASFGHAVSMSDFVQGPHQAELKAKVAEVIVARSDAEWRTYAEQNDVPIEPVLSPSEIKSDAHLAARGVFFEVLGSADGKSPAVPLPQVRTPVTPADKSFMPPPRQGEHTREILTQAGLSNEQIEALLASGGAR